MVDEVSPKKVFNTTLLIEAAIRERKFFKVYQEFKPNPAAQSLSPKFYARHEHRDAESVPEEYLELCAKYDSSTPQDRASYPQTENQRYGWYNELLCGAAHCDRRLNYHKRQDPEIKLAGILKKLQRKEKPFEGTPFKI